MNSGMQIARVQPMEGRTGQGGLSLPGPGIRREQASTAPREAGEPTFDGILSGYRVPPDREAVPELVWVTGQENRLRWAATELEAVLLRDLLNTMLAPGKGSFWGKGPGVEVYSSLFLDEIARELARSGQFGVADMLVGQLQSRSQEEAAGATYADRPGSGQPSRFAG